MFEPQELVPDYWRIEPETIEDIVFAGRDNIEQMIRSWNYTFRYLDDELERTNELIGDIAHANGKTIAVEALKFEMPEFTAISVVENIRDNPEPTDEASINRRSNTTTWNVCGWCKYATGGSARYGYYINPSCMFEAYSGVGENERRFSTPCFLLRASDETFRSILDGLRKNWRECTDKRNTVGNKKVTLQRLIEDAEIKPVFSDHRPYDYFNVGDRIMVYIANWDNRIVDKHWAVGEVIFGYRHHDGCVSFRLDERVSSGDYLDGHGGGAGLAHPTVVKQWEYDYLRDHADFAEYWVTYGVSRYIGEFNRDEYLASLKEFINV